MDLLSVIEEPQAIVLRDYQAEALDKVRELSAKHKTQMVVSPTGTGKTVSFCELIRRTIADGGRAMVIVDRQELLHQTARTIRRMTGMDCDIEQAGNYSNEREGFKSPVVVAMIQTLDSKGSGGRDGYRRFERFDPAEFALVVVDECHLSITERHTRAINWFRRNEDCLVVGFTATPMRSDNKSLGQIYEVCAYRYDIRDAIDDGWLVPVDGHPVRVESLDLSVLPNKRGDWTDDEIGRVMEDNATIYEVVGTLERECGGEPTVVFCARVSHAELMTHALNTQIGPNAARCIHGETPDPVRKRYNEQFQNGEINFLVNCAVLTTGWDAPIVRNVAMCRPTKSASLFIQCVGRGLRPLPGVVDGVEEAMERRGAISASPKPRCRVLSFVGRAGGVDLCGPEDVLAGDMDDPEIVKRAKEIADEDESKTLEERIEQAEEEVRERRRQAEAAPVRALVQYSVGKEDLFASGEGNSKVRAGDLATVGQLKILRDAGVPESKMRRLRYDKQTAGKLASLIVVRRKKGLATYKQCSLLLRTGYRRDQYRDMTVQQATELIERTRNNGWRPVSL